MAGDRPRQLAYEIFNIKCTFQQSKSRPSRFKESCVRRCQRGVPFWKVVIYLLLSCLAWKWLQIGTYMSLIITSTGDELLRNVNVDDLKWAWALKILILSDFLTIFGCRRVNCDEIDGRWPGLLASMNCHGLSRVSWALAQISCYCTTPYFR